MVREPRREVGERDAERARGVGGRRFDGQIERPGEEAVTNLVGETPLSFLTRMRMQEAIAPLREGATLATTSQLTDYASEASFSHAFRLSPQG